MLSDLVEKSLEFLKKSISFRIPGEIGEIAGRVSNKILGRISGRRGVTPQEFLDRYLLICNSGTELLAKAHEGDP